jgi:putative cell wall-binding protein
MTASASTASTPTHSVFGVAGRRLLATTLAGVLLVTALSVAPPASAAPIGPFDGDPTTTTRVFAREAITAGVAISKARFEDGAAAAAVLSRNDTFPDSLAGSALTGDAPLLFTRTGDLPEPTRAELRRVLPQGATVYLLGGTAAIGGAVADAVAAQGYEVVRLGGADRVATALVVADEVLRRGGAANRVLLARSGGLPHDETAGWADSVTAGGVAARDLTPLLLTQSDMLDSRVDAWLRARGVSATVLLGGTAALSPAVEQATPGPTRVSGLERTATATEVARQLWPSRAAVTVTSARHPAGWALGLAAGGLAADAGAPLLLLESGVSPAVRALVSSCGPARLDTAIIGDGSVVAPQVREALDAYDGGACGPGGTLAYSAALSAYDACAPLLDDIRTAALERVGPYGLEGVVFGSPGRDTDDSEGAPTPQPAPGSPADDGGGEQPPRSGSNIQEEGVDEPDIVKDDGTLAVAVARGRLQVVDLRSGDPVLAASMVAPEGHDHRLLLSGDTLVVLSRGGYGDYYPMPGPAPAPEPAPAPGPAPEPNAFSSPAGSYTPVTHVTTVDLSTPSAPRVVGSAQYEGDLRSARMVGTTVRLVVQSQPSLPFVYPGDGSEEAHEAAAAHNRGVIRTAPLSEWLPTFRVGEGSERPLLDCEQVARPPWWDGLGVLGVVTFDAADPTPTSAAGVLARGDLVYASPTTLVVSSSRWHGGEVQLTGETVSTELHSFAIDDPAATRYLASGTVSGHVLNAFSISEQDGRIRVATTSQEPWRQGDVEPRSESAVRILERSGTTLEEIGVVGGLGIGERIYAVRFLGDLAAVVTFRQVDPLYLIDLSDPRSPRLTGELKIPGYSAYLHRVGPDLLLGVGQDATDEGFVQGMQVSLFDIADRSDPRRVSTLTYRDTYSEVEHDHLAFLHWPPSSLAVVPYLSWQDGTNGAIGVRIDGTTLHEQGRLTHQRNAGDWENPIRRSFVVGDTLYTVSERGLEAASTTTLTRRGFVEFD